MTNDQIEAMIKERGLTAPRVSKQDIEAEIISEFYLTGAQAAFVACASSMEHPEDAADLALPDPLNRLTICILCLRNGYTVIGVSACVSAENYNADMGQMIARENAIGQIHGLLAFNLTQHLYTLNERKRAVSELEHGAEQAS